MGASDFSLTLEGRQQLKTLERHDMLPFSCIALVIVAFRWQTARHGLFDRMESGCLGGPWAE